jgi:hypothetical protein
MEHDTQEQTTRGGARSLRSLTATRFGGYTAQQRYLEVNYHLRAIGHAPALLVPVAGPSITNGMTVSSCISLYRGT